MCTSRRQLLASRVQAAREQLLDRAADSARSMSKKLTGVKTQATAVFKR